MEHIRARTLILTVVAVSAPALLVAALVRTGLPAAQATHLTPLPTNTPGGPTNTPTPQPDGQGPLSGVYDMLVHDNSETMGFYHCIVRLDEDSTSHKIATAAQCYADIEVGDPNAEPAVRPPDEGPNRLPGPPPPMPYDTAAPANGRGKYDPNTDALYLSSCLPNLGGQLGPNAIAVIEFHATAAQLAANGRLDGELALSRRQGTLQCDDYSPKGASDQMQPVTLHPIGDVNGPGRDWPAPWRTLGDTDFDNDGCSDAGELWTLKTAAPTCGDDPYNALDPGVGSPPNVAGNYTFVFTLARADACWSGMRASGPCALADGTIIPGSYYTCAADLQQTGKSVTARMLCYIDAPNVVVNPQLAGDNDHNGAPDVACPPAPASQCGDGLLGAAPPGATAPAGPKLFADIDDRHLVLTGELHNETGMLMLRGCWENRDGFAAPGNVYLSVAFNAHTGHGDASIWTHQLSSACAGGAPSGAPPAATVDAVRQATTAQGRDTDSDGCPDARELGDSAPAGGLRDPLNRWDYPDMPTGVGGAKDHKIRINDVSYVIQRYRHDAGGTTSPLYDPQADHGAPLPGSNPWNLTPGNGQVRIDDVSAVIQQYRADCV